MTSVAWPSCCFLAPPSLAPSATTLYTSQSGPSTLYTSQSGPSTLYTSQYGPLSSTVYSVHSTLYSVHCTVYTVHCILYTAQCTLCSLLDSPKFISLDSLSSLTPPTDSQTFQPALFLTGICISIQPQYKKLSQLKVALTVQCVSKTLWPFPISVYFQSPVQSVLLLYSRLAP